MSAAKLKPAKRGVLQQDLIAELLAGGCAQSLADVRQAARNKPKPPNP